jgi:hypothetical protein
MGYDDEPSKTSKRQTKPLCMGKALSRLRVMIVAAHYIIKKTGCVSIGDCHNFKLYRLAYY